MELLGPAKIDSLYSTEIGSAKLVPDVRHFWKALKASNDSVFFEKFEPDFLLLLTDAQRSAYVSLSSSDARKAYVQIYWKARDPNPLLPVNLSLREHVRRRQYVRRHFSTSRPPYYDDRGKYYLRFGEPLVRFQDPGGFKYVEALGRRHHDADYMVLANESWSYENVLQDFVVHFAAEGQTFRKIESLHEVVAGPARRDALAFHWNDIVKERAAVSPVLARAAMESERIETALKMARFSGDAGLLASDIAMPTERIFQAARANEHYLTSIEEEAPALALEPLDGVNLLPLSSTIAQFKADRGRTRVEVTFYSSVRNYPTAGLADKLDLIDVEYSYLFRDSTYEDVVHGTEDIDLPYSEARKLGVDFVVGRLDFTVSPQEGDLTVQARDRDGRIGFTRQRLRIRDFARPDLMISDLQFYTRSDEQRVQRLLPSHEINGAPVCAYPAIEISRAKPLLCYFEVYNAADREVDKEYEVTYELFLSGAKNQRVASTSLSYYQRFASRTSQEMFTTDLGKLQPGLYEMEITVRAQGEAGNTAHASRGITIVD